MKTIAEASVKAAFITLMNKLTWGRSRVLLPFAKMLKVGSNGKSLERFSEIESHLEKNAKRRAQITQFFTKGLLYPAVYEEDFRRRLNDWQRNGIH